MQPSSLNACYNIADLRQRAQRCIPAPLFHYIDGGAGAEWTMARNTSAFDRVVLEPRVLTDVSEVDTSHHVLGRDLALPFILSPTGMNRLFHHDGEMAVSRAASDFGCYYTLSTLASSSMEDVAAVASGAKMFQVYVLKDRTLMQDFISGAKNAGFDALCLTVDTPVPGARERDWRTGMTMPPRLTLRSLFDFARRPRWLYHYLRSPGFRLANVEHRVDALAGGSMGLMDYVHSQFDRSVTWEDARWLRENWDGTFVIKGILSAKDAVRAADLGADAVMISNHGGRQLDGVPSPIECLQPIRDAVGDSLALIVDGGIRRGSHAAKAIALGADAVSFGRPYLYGLAAGGYDGVCRALDLLRNDFLRTMALMGARSVADLRGRAHWL